MHHQQLSHATIITTALILTGCGKKDKQYDATGIFETTEVIVSAEQNGKLIVFNTEEGNNISEGQLIGTIDTTQLYLKAKQIGALKNVYAVQRPETAKQIAATKQQLKKAEKEEARFKALVNEGAANGKQLDDARNQVLVLHKQLAAQLSSLNTSTQSLNAQMSTTDIERMQVADQLQKCRITSPISGTVLEKYAEQGEFATVGKPLFKVANMHDMFLRAYITSEQLSRVKIGQTAKVFADYGGGKLKEYKGTVSWISAKSEFTPKTILTDDERADLVYAVKIAVKNDGYIKIGMYGEVKF